MGDFGLELAAQGPRGHGGTVGVVFAFRDVADEQGLVVLIENHRGYAAVFIADARQRQRGGLGRSAAGPVEIGIGGAEINADTLHLSLP